jgi:hypothetical protein
MVPPSFAVTVSTVPSLAISPASVFKIAAFLVNNQATEKPVAA